ncbi:DUF6099 family protein [Streptomyces sp. NPDC051286]|uniref:DUF6099 family protein n=1 Tax=Streptomyces sp. NPDC051286 TaxID=3365647 RepID=UPI0037ADC0B2
MEAERLIEVSRRALAQSRGAPSIMAEAWQVQALAQAIGERLAAHGPKVLRGEARRLGEIGGSGGVAPDHPVVRTGTARAAQLAEIADPRAALTGLGALLGEMGMALVAVACDTGEESLYWQCIEAIDAADEALDRVHGMLRLLAEQDREQNRQRERDGAYGAVRGPAGSAAGQP